MTEAHEFDEILPAFYSDPENGISSCTLCGAPLHSPDYLRGTSAPPSRQWTGRAILLTDKSLDFTVDRLDDLPSDLLTRERQIARLHAAPLARTFFEITEEGSLRGKVVAANQSEGDFHAELYLPAHEACVEMLDRFLAVGMTAPPPLVGPWTISKVWDVVRLRMEADYGDEYAWSPLDGIQQIREPNNYYIPGGFQNAFQWPDRDSLEDPIVVPGYTESLLQHLQPFPKSIEAQPDDAVATLRSAMERLSQELQDRVIDQMAPTTSISRGSNGTLSQDTWRELLTNTSIFPWLWDVDRSAMEHHAASQASPLDYEHLFRQLAQPEIFEKGQALHDAPVGLRNRRRIWRVLENMRAGDLLK